MICSFKMISNLDGIHALFLGSDGIIVIGEVTKTPDPERRFWGGGTYIMPQKVPTNGTAVRIDYTALLNTQGNSDIIHFKFIVGLMRELPDQYQLIHSTEVENFSGVPTHLSGYNGTIHLFSFSVRMSTGRFRRETSSLCLCTIDVQVTFVQQM